MIITQTSETLTLQKEEEMCKGPIFMLMSKRRHSFLPFGVTAGWGNWSPSRKTEQPQHRECFLEA